MNGPTAVIAEDEPLLRAEIRDLLHRYWPELHISAEAEDGTQAIEALDRHGPNVLFLDIQMPDLLGTDFVRSLTPAPKIIFTSANSSLLFVLITKIIKS